MKLLAYTTTDQSNQFVKQELQLSAGNPQDGNSNILINPEKKSLVLVLRSRIQLPT